MTDDRKHDDDLDFDAEFVLEDDFSDDFLDDDVDRQAPARHAPAARAKPGARRDGDADRGTASDPDAGLAADDDADGLWLSAATPGGDDDWSADHREADADDVEDDAAAEPGALRLSNDFDGVVDDWSADFASEEDDLFAELEVEPVGGGAPRRASTGAFGDLDDGGPSGDDGSGFAAVPAPDFADAGDLDEIAASDAPDDGDGEDDGDDEDRDGQWASGAFDGSSHAGAGTAFDGGALRAVSFRAAGDDADRDDDAADDLFADLDDPADDAAAAAHADVDPADEPAPWARDDLDEDAAASTPSDRDEPAFAGLELRDASPFTGRDDDPVRPAFRGADELGDASDADVEDELFDGIERDVTYNAFTGEAGSAFAEDGPGWPGADEDVEAIVTAAADDDLGHAGVFDLDDVEIEQVDPGSAAAPRTPRRPTAPQPLGVGDDASWNLDADDDRDGDPRYVLVDDQDAFVGAGAGAGLELLDEAPPEAFDEDDPIYGSDAEAVPAAAGVPGFEIPAGHAAMRRESDEFEDDPYIDDTAEDYEVHVVGPGAGRTRTALWSSLAAVAALLVIAGLSVTMIAPEWLGLAPRAPKVDRTAIARPQIGLVRRAPELPTVAVAEPAPVTPGAGTEPEQPVRDGSGGVAVVTPTEPAGTDPASQPTDPVRQPDGTTPNGTGPDGANPIAPTEPTPPQDPKLAGGPAATEPGRAPAPVVALPEIDREAVAASRRPERTRRVRTGFEPIDQGGDLVIAGPTREVVDHGGDVVVPGDRAFAQLTNDAVFIGTVRKIDLAAVTLDMPSGEVTLPRGELVALLHYDDSIGSEFVKDARGFVEIDNANRLQGRIVHTASTDTLVLETDVSRVTVPRSAVVQVGTYAGDGVDLAPIEDDGAARWLRDRALRRMQQPVESRSGAAKPPARR